MDGGEPVFDVDTEIARVITSVAKPSALVTAETRLADKEREIAAIRAEIAELVAQVGKDTLIGRARQQLVRAMGEHGQLMNKSAQIRRTYYRHRAEALQPTAQRALDVIGQILDLSLPGASWVEIAASPRLQVLVSAYNRLALSESTWCDRGRAPLPLRQENAFRSIVSRHRSR